MHDDMRTCTRPHADAPRKLHARVHALAKVMTARQPHGNNAALAHLGFDLVRGEHTTGNLQIHTKLIIIASI